MIHIHEWRLGEWLFQPTVEEMNNLFAICVSEHCNERMERTEIERRLNAWEANRKRLEAMERHEVRVVEDDEIVVGSLFHMERMSEQHIWFRIGDAAFDLEIVGRRLRWALQSGDEWTTDMLGLAAAQERDPGPATVEQDRP